MLKLYVKASEAVRRLRKDQAGVVSFEYVIVAACVVGAVLLAFGNDASSGLGKVLDTAVKAIGSKIAGATS